MKHPDLPTLADHARGLAETTEFEATRDHLASGCSRCDRLAQAFSRVLAASAATAACEPPDYAVRSIKAYFGIARPNTASAWEKVSLALGFDSALAAVPVGVRNEDGASRHISYESGQYLVDVVVEQPTSTSEGIVAGQILRQLGGPIVPIAEIPAFLMSRGELLATALTSDQGGFSLEGGLGGACELWFFLEDERVIGVTWDQDQDAPTEH